jgi:hypothetical protein
MVPNFGNAGSIPAPLSNFKKLNIMKLANLKEVLNDGRIFNVTFVKNDGSIRRFNARLGVRSHLKGGVMTYNPESRDNLIVFSMDDKGYRTIKLDNILILKANGKTYKTSKFLELMGY